MFIVIVRNFNCKKNFQQRQSIDRNAVNLKFAVNYLYDCRKKLLLSTYISSRNERSN